MSKIVKCNLTGGGLTDLIAKLNGLKNDVNTIKKEIITELKEEGYKEIQSSLSNSEYQPNDETIAIMKDNCIGISGTQALYDEYGTGTLGAEDGHPDKVGMGLNPYNSGKTIRTNKSDDTNASKNGIPAGEKYWTYMYNGEKIYTMGRPSGKHVYKAQLKIKDKMKEITSKKVGEILSKL